MPLDVQDLLLTWAEGREREYLQLLAQWHVQVICSTDGPMTKRDVRDRQNNRSAACY